MTAAALVLSARNHFEHLFNALVDPARRERTMAVALACYFAIWSLYAAIAKSSQDIPSTLDIDNPTLTPWVGVDRIRREGAAIVCPEKGAFCMRALRGYTTYYHVVADENVVVSRRFFGFASPPERYEIIVIPPDPSQGMHSALAPER
jgi:hypothetical protein